MFARLLLSQSFQSTLSMRRATHLRAWSLPSCDISIHALHEESDHPRLVQLSWWCGFQSTLSMRRATYSRYTVHMDINISIHALHEESD